MRQRQHVSAPGPLLLAAFAACHAPHTHLPADTALCVLSLPVLCLAVAVAAGAGPWVTSLPSLELCLLGR
jgi:hypothetical protein